MENIEEDLLELKEKIEKAKMEKAQIEGRLQGLRERLQKEFNCSSFDEAKKQLEKLEAERDPLEQELREEVEKLRDKYDD